MGQETAAPSSQDRGPGASIWLKTLPAVIENMAKMARPMPSGVPMPSPSLVRTTSATPASPMARPIHWRRVTTSPSKGPAKAAVSTG